MTPPVWLTRAVALAPTAVSLLTRPTADELLSVAPLLADAVVAGYFRGRPAGAWACLAGVLAAAACGLARLWDRFRPPPPPVEGLDLYGSVTGDALLVAGLWAGALLAVAAGFVATAVCDPLSRARDADPRA